MKTFSPIIYLDVQLAPGAQFLLPSDYSEQAIYTVTAGVRIDGTQIPQHRLAILKPGSAISISADRSARCMVIGGEPVGTRIKWWNFVSSSHQRIDRAKQDWQQGRFDKIPGETEFIPLPEVLPHQEQPL